jgi:hypothetical protein
MLVLGYDGLHNPVRACQVGLELLMGLATLSIPPHCLASERSGHVCAATVYQIRAFRCVSASSGTPGKWVQDPRDMFQPRLCTAAPVGQVTDPNKIRKDIEKSTGEIWSATYPKGGFCPGACRGLWKELGVVGLQKRQVKARPSVGKHYILITYYASKYTFKVYQMHPMT